MLAILILGFSGWIRTGGLVTTNLWLLPPPQELSAGGWVLESYAHHTLDRSGLYGMVRLEQYWPSGGSETFLFPFMGVWTGTSVQAFLETEGTWASRPDYPRSLRLSGGLRTRWGDLTLQRVIGLSYDVTDWRLEGSVRGIWRNRGLALEVAGFAGGLVRTFSDTTTGDTFSRFPPWRPGFGMEEAGSIHRVQVTGGRAGVRLRIQNRRIWTRWAGWIQAQVASGDAGAAFEYTRDPSSLLLGTPYAYHGLEGGVWGEMDLPGHLQIRGRLDLSRRWYLDGREDLTVGLSGGVERALWIRWSVFLEGDWLRNRSSRADLSTGRWLARMGVRHLF